MLSEFELYHFDIFGRFLSKNFQFDRKTDDVISLKMIRTNLVNLIDFGRKSWHADIICDIICLCDLVKGRCKQMCCTFTFTFLWKL